MNPTQRQDRRALRASAVRVAAHRGWAAGRRFVGTIAGSIAFTGLGAMARPALPALGTAAARRPGIQ